jgi:ABC-2 type transport system ATP-binding protein
LNFQVWGKVGKAIRFVRGFYPGWDDTYCAAADEGVSFERQRQGGHAFVWRENQVEPAARARAPPGGLILDEPTTGLDAVSKQQVFSELLKAVEDGERTVLISSHGLSDIERFADHVGMIKDGKLLLEGRTDEVVDRYRLAEFFTSNGTTLQSPEPEGLIILKWNENRWHALLDQNSGAQELAGNEWRATDLAHPADAGRFVRGAGQRKRRP